MNKNKISYRSPKNDRKNFKKFLSVVWGLQKFCLFAILANHNIFIKVLFHFLPILTKIESFSSYD